MLQSSGCRSKNQKADLGARHLLHTECSDVKIFYRSSQLLTH